MSDKSHRAGTRASVVHVLSLLRDTGEPITFKGDQAFVWLEPVPRETLNELLACRALSPVGGDCFALSINSIGRQVIGTALLAPKIKQAIASGHPFAVRGGQIEWETPGFDLKFKRIVPPV